MGLGSITHSIGHVVSSVADVAKASAGFGVGAVSGATLALGGKLSAQTVAIDAAGLAAGAGVAALSGPAVVPAAAATTMPPAIGPTAADLASWGYAGAAPAASGASSAASILAGGAAVSQVAGALRQVQQLIAGGSPGAPGAYVVAGPSALPPGYVASGPGAAGAGSSSGALQGAGLVLFLVVAAYAVYRLTRKG